MCAMLMNNIHLVSFHHLLIPATSDTDIRGIALPTKEMVVGIDGDFEQASNSDTDTVIYSLIKMVKLLLSCNPNCIEILGDRPEDYSTNMLHILIVICTIFKRKQFFNFI